MRVRTTTRVRRPLRAAAVAVAASAATLGLPGLAAPALAATPGRHVVLISVDGLHASDLAAYIAAHPTSAMAALARAGTTYANARTPSLSDSFPGLMALLAGGSPRSTGVYYDNTYDRTFYPAGSSCTGVPGTETLYDSSLDRLDGAGKIPLDTTLDPATFPRDAACAPVGPSAFLGTNTVFSVVHAAGLRTAWIDKHPAYQIVAGHGTPDAVDDLYTPEIDAEALPATHSDLRGGTVSFDTTKGITASVANTEAYDSLHVGALLNELDGKRSDGTGSPGVPALLGMNMQSVSVGQKLVDKTQAQLGGYNADGTFTPQLLGALDFVDGALARVRAEITAQGLGGSTEIILTAKHGQSPIDPTTLAKVGDPITPVIGASSVAQQTADDVSLLWLTPGTDVAAKAADLRAAAGSDRCATVSSGAALGDQFGVRTPGSLQEARQPDILCQPVPGTIYTSSSKKVAEHGGLTDDDTHVALLVARPGAAGSTVRAAVTTAQVAPTILRDLGLYGGDDPAGSPLDAVRAEGTQPLANDGPLPVLPEAPLVALLPLGGIAAAGLVLARRRRLARA